MKIIRISSEEAKEFLAVLKEKLDKSALEGAMIMEQTPRGLVDLATIIRETVLESEDKRLAAGRKAKEGA